MNLHSNYRSQQNNLISKKLLLIYGCFIITCLIVIQLIISEDDDLFQETNLSQGEQFLQQDFHFQKTISSKPKEPNYLRNLSQDTSLSNSTSKTLFQSKKGIGSEIILSNLKDDDLSNFAQDVSGQQHWPMITPLREENISQYPISSHFGYRLDPIHHFPSMHQGVDFLAPIGTPIVATADGTITKAGQADSYGLLVEIQHANGFKSKYAHTSLIQVKLGDQVKQGQLIAYVGNSGRSTGSHLHYEVLISNKPIDPMRLFR